MDIPHDQQTQDTRHHEQVPSTQAAFQKHVRDLRNVITEMGDPFMEDSSDLITLDTKNIMDDTAVDRLHSIQDIGQAQYASFKDDVLHTGRKSISEPISRNKSAIFKDQSIKKQPPKRISLQQ